MSNPPQLDQQKESSRRLLPRSRIAVIGAGVSGMVAARILSADHEVHLLEADSRPGGHANTVDVTIDGRQVSVDTGFMVFNRETYPNFCRLLELLEVESQDGDMSFSVSCERSGLEYQGSSLGGLFAQRSNLVRPSFYRLLWDIVRFNREALAFIKYPKDGQTLGDFLSAGRYSPALSEHYLLPMTAAIWSTQAEKMREFPARFILGFMANHGLLNLRERPQWKTIPGGSRMYVERLLTPLGESVRTGTEVTRVTRHCDHVVVQLAGEAPEVFDYVIFACHADQALRILSDATSIENEVLASFPYQANQAVLHTDTSFLPQRKAAWASWNYRINGNKQHPTSITYDLTRLQLLDADRPILVTLNPDRPISHRYLLREFVYHHPLFTMGSIAAQSRWEEINGELRTFYCGAYWRNGFHEDGVVSALSVTQKFGLDLEACKAASTKELFHTSALVS